MNRVERVASRIKARFLAENTGHDWYHIQRVRRLAQQIAAEEGAAAEVVELAALVHDIADWKFHGGDDSVGPREARLLLAEEEVPEAVIAAVVDIVASISYKGAGVADRMASLEGRCVQDADRLDALGAIGIARCFAYGGHAGRLIHDPAVKPVLHASAEAYKTAQGTSLNHFYEKLLLLRDRMHTDSGRRLAEERHRYLEDFVARFLAEWGDD